MLDLLKNLLPYIRPYKWMAIGTIIFSFVIAAIGGAQVSLIRPIFDNGLSPDATNREIYILAGKLLILGLLNFPARFFHFYWLRYIVDKATCAVREKIFTKMQRLPSSFYAQARQGQLISNIVNDSLVYSQGFRAMVNLVREPLKALVYLGMAFWADWQLTVVILLIAPFLTAVFVISGKKVKNNQSNVQAQHADLTHNIAEGLSGHKITKAFNLQNFVRQRFKAAQDRFFNAQMRTTFVEEMAHPFVELIGAIAFAGLIIFAHFRIQSGETTIGEFVSFAAAMALFMDPIRKFSQSNVKLSQARAAYERLSYILDLSEEGHSGDVVKIQFKEKIEVQNLFFNYGEADVLKNFSLEIKAGEKIGLVGLSGSGKSTLINLLLGLYPVEEGSLVIDGKPIQRYKLHALRDLFGLVSQDVFLFNDSVRENLCLGKKYSDEEIWKALDVAYAKEFVEKLPNGLETIVGDRGTRLSGGQQQRLTIARAFLLDPPILLFDEATSALDNESEKVVQKALEDLARNKTVIAVAHRLSTIQEYDRIYVLHEGEIVEKGTHHELIKKGGEYSKLYELSLKN
mgnify:CR=1 FL=1